MAQSYLGQKRLRRYYGKIREVLEMPNLIEVQKSSYDLFLNSGDGPQPQDGEGIKGVFQSAFPIKDFNETSVLEFVSYELEKHSRSVKLTGSLVGLNARAIYKSSLSEIFLTLAS